ncbi:MAG: 3-deoxy-D-manno-octulosonic acid transferase [Crocinitomicaceae bacterium]|nr:3-deoxy-D-manno-octulosonic acid transferase [Crocinitomicaceae bacterium]
MHFIYNSVIQLYELAIRTAALFNPKAKNWVDGRKDYFENLPEIPINQKVIWFHCASLGEFDMALPVMNLIKERQPTIFLLVTFFSPSGMEHYSKRKHKVDLAVYLPSDKPSNAEKFITYFHPDKVFFVKYEFWSNYIFEAKKEHVQVFSLCSIFREDHRFFKWYGGFFRKTLKKVDFFYTQNETSTLLLADIGITNFMTSGDTRFDRVIENKKSIESNPRIEAFLNDEKAVIIGSSWPDDEAIVLPYILQNPNKKFIIAPHNVDEANVRAIETQLFNLTERFSEKTSGKNILILNTIGHLASAYSYGEIAYIGGGFSGNLHNILEPAVFGLPVLFGPKYKRFPEASQFIHLGIGFSVKTSDDYTSALKAIYNNLPLISEKTSTTVINNTGASVKILDHLEQHFGL